jgi:NAD(P)-dependent dehydrogenase (short-subunit alcohol dehydrogenase family)
MTSNMTDKIALITGGSRGLGRNTAIHLARAGIDVVLTYHSNQAEAEAAVQEITALGRKAVGLQLDTSDVATFEDFVDRFRDALQTTFDRDSFDYLVNNAGTAGYAPFAEATEEDFDRLTNIHFKGVFFLTQKLLPLIVDGGKIVNLSSGLARFAMPGSSIYGSLKGAVEVLSRYLAKELGHRRIAVNAVAPGAIETDFGGGRVRDDAETNQRIASMTAMGRVGLPDDVGGAITALLTGETGWITGQRIEVSGGQAI